MYFWDSQICIQYIVHFSSLQFVYLGFPDVLTAYKEKYSILYVYLGFPDVCTCYAHYIMILEINRYCSIVILILTCKIYVYMVARFARF